MSASIMSALSAAATASSTAASTTSTTTTASSQQSNGTNREFVEGWTLAQTLGEGAYGE